MQLFLTVSQNKRPFVTHFSPFNHFEVLEKQLRHCRYLIADVSLCLQYFAYFLALSVLLHAEYLSLLYYVPVISKITAPFSPSPFHSLSLSPALARTQHLLLLLILLLLSWILQSVGRNRRSRERQRDRARERERERKRERERGEWTVSGSSQTVRESERETDSTQAAGYRRYVRGCGFPELAEHCTDILWAWPNGSTQRVFSALR